MKLISQWLKPTYIYPKVEDLPLADFYEAGIRGLILDLDDTLTRKNSTYFTPAVREWLQDAKRRGIQCYIVSNNRYPKHVETVSALLNIPAVAQAHKPSARYLLQALSEMNLPPQQVLVVGDRLLTDVLGGNYLNMPTCLLTPLNPKPRGVMKWVYPVENWLLKWIRSG